MESALSIVFCELKSPPFFLFFIPVSWLLDWFRGEKKVNFHLPSPFNMQQFN